MPTRRILLVAALAFARPAAAHEPLPASQPATSRPAAPTTSPAPDPLAELQLAIDAILHRASDAVVAVHAEPYPGQADRAVPALRATLTGTGFFIDPGGTILTSEHVIRDAREVFAIPSSGRRLRARIVAADPRADLAVLRVESSSPAVLELSARPPQRGQLVFAIGHPAGLLALREPSISAGIASAVGRPLPESLGEHEDRYYGDMVQIAAAIGPGYSGGPLLDRHGRVVGVLTAITAGSHESAGLGFAVPINPRTRAAIARLQEGSRPEYGYLGVRVADRPADETAAPGGVAVLAILPGSPAERIGLRQGDTLTTLDGRPVESADAFIQDLGARGPDADIELGLLREGDRRVIRAILTRRPPPNPDAPRRQLSFRGAILAPLDEPTRKAGNLPPAAWIVTRVESGSRAYAAGLSPGDIVTYLDGRPPDADLHDAGDADTLATLASGATILIRAK